MATKGLGQSISCLLRTADLFLGETIIPLSDHIYQDTTLALQFCDTLLHHLILLGSCSSHVILQLRHVKVGYARTHSCVEIERQDMTTRGVDLPVLAGVILKEAALLL